MRRTGSDLRDAAHHLGRWWVNAKMWYALCMVHTERFVVSLGDRGRLVLPAALRYRLGLSRGDRLILTVDPEGGFRVVSARELARRFNGIFKDLAPVRSLVDELIAERREEAQREEQEIEEAAIKADRWRNQS